MDRLELIRNAVLKRRFRAFLVSNITNIHYLTGFSGSSALLLITAGGAYFFTDFRYKEQSLQEVKGCEIVVPKGSLMACVKRVLKRMGIGLLGFELSAPFLLYHSLKRGLRLRPVDGLVESLRVKKDRYELSRIREAVRRAEAAFTAVKGHLKKDTSEISFARRLELRLKREGCVRLPFDIIVASGERSALPHARATQRRLNGGDLVIIDWGGEADGYFSDMTRSFIVKGEDIGAKVAIYNTVRRANRKAIKEVVPGRKTRDIDRVARDFISRSGYGRYFGHGTGHGVGLDIHEPPRISWIGEETLEKGMVFTIEPGIYVPGLGGVRIEDMVVVTGKGRKVMTGLPRRLEVI